MAKNFYITDMPKNFTKTIEATFLLREITKKQTQENKKNYYNIQLMDATGTIWGVIWEQNMEKGHEELKGKIVSIRALVAQDAKGVYQLVVNSMEESYDYMMTDYINGLTVEESTRYKELLWKYINSIQNDSYKSIVSTIYQKIPDLEQFPASLKGHHSFGGGFLVYTVSTTCLAHHMLLSFNRYNVNPSYQIPYDSDLLIAGGLLHAVGTVRMITPCPDMHRIPESIPLSLYELTMRHIQEAICLNKNIEIGSEHLNLLLHMVGCVYESEERKPMLREAVLLKQAAVLHEKISLLEHFMYLNWGKNGMIFDDKLGNYIYLKREEK